MPKARRRVAAGFNLRKRGPRIHAVPNGTTAIDYCLAVVPFGTAFVGDRSPRTEVRGYSPLPRSRQKSNGRCRSGLRQKSLQRRAGSQILAVAGGFHYQSTLLWQTTRRRHYIRRNVRLINQPLPHSDACSSLAILDRNPSLLIRANVIGSGAN